MYDAYLFADVIEVTEEYDGAIGHLPPVLSGANDSLVHSWLYELFRNYLSMYLSKAESEFRRIDDEDREQIQQIISAESPWDSVETRTAIERLSRLDGRVLPGGRFAMPVSFPFVDKLPFPRCHVLAVSGPGTAFERGVTTSMKELDDDTILFVESKDGGRAWWQPQDVDLIGNLDEQLGSPMGVSSDHPFGFLVGFKDGTVWRLSHSIPADTLRAFMDIRSAMTHERNVLLRPWKFDLGAEILNKLARE